MTPDLIPLEEIERLKKLDEAATHPRWERCTCSFQGACPHLPGYRISTDCEDAPASKVDRELGIEARNALPSLLAAAECAHRQRAEIERLREIVNSLPKTADSEPIYFGRRLYVIDDGDDEDEYQEPYDPVEGWFVVQGIEPSCGANGEDLITVCDENDCFEVWSSLCYAKNPIGEPTP